MAEKLKKLSLKWGISGCLICVLNLICAVDTLRNGLKMLDSSHLYKTAIEAVDSF